ncbi:hypothetical protein FRC06_008420, partial [Ceratobasidium sp. 370]
MGHRKHNSSSAPPAPKRRRADSNSVPEAVESTQPGLNEVSSHVEADLDMGLAIGREEETKVDEDGSFFHPPPKAPATDTMESCIKFVHVLPSEMQKRSTTKEAVGFESAGDGEGTRRITQSSQKASQAVSSMPVSARLGHTQKPRQASSTKPKLQPNPKKKATPKRKADLERKAKAKSKCDVATMEHDTPPQNQHGEDSDEEIEEYKEEVEEFIEDSNEVEEIGPDDAAASATATLQGLRQRLSVCDSDSASATVTLHGLRQRLYSDFYYGLTAPFTALKRYICAILAFAIKRAGAHDIIRLPVPTSNEMFRFHVSEVLDCVPSELRLAYKVPGAKKSDLRLHLCKNPGCNVIRGWLMAVNADIKAASGGKGKWAMDKRAKAVDKLKSYMITISNPSSLGSNAGGNKAQGQKDASAAQRRYHEYLKSNQPKCNTCQENCGIILLPERGPTHVPLTEECLDLWAKLAVLKQASPYSTTPPPQVLDLLRVKAQACAQSKSDTSDEQQLVIAPNCSFVQTSLPFPNALSPGLSTSVSTPAHRSTALFSPTPGSVGLGAPQLALNPALFAAAGQVGGLGTGFGTSILPSLPTQIPQFSTGMGQSPVIMYNVPQGISKTMFSY